MVAVILVSLFGSAATQVYAQVKVQAPGVNVSVDGANMKSAVSVGSGNTVINSSGGIGSDVEMEGVAIINGEVFIDGDKIPKGKATHKGRKSGKSYRITWGKGDNVSVEEK